MKLKIGLKFMILGIAAVTFTGTFLGGYYYWHFKTHSQEYIDKYEENILKIEKQHLEGAVNLVLSDLEKSISDLQEETHLNLRSNMDVVFDIIETQYRKTIQHGVTQAEKTKIRQNLLDTLKNIHFGKSGYVWIHSFDQNDTTKSTMIMHPSLPELIGTDISVMKYRGGPYKGKPIIGASGEKSGALIPLMNRIVADQKEGFVDYLWYTSGQEVNELRPKSSFVRLFEPWGWVIGTGIYIKEIETKLKQDALNRIRNLRYGKNGNGYFWVHTYNPKEVDSGIILEHPDFPELEKSDIFSLPYMFGPNKGETIFAEDTPDRKPFLVYLNKAIRKNGRGYVRHQWPVSALSGNGPNEYQPKLSYGKLFHQWNWVIGTGVYLQEHETDKALRMQSVKNKTADLFFINVLICIALILISSTAVYFLSRTLIKPIQILCTRMNEYAQGDRTLRELPVTNDEIGDLSMAFSKLRLENTFILRTLEDRVREKTARLAETLEKLTNQHMELNNARKKAEVANIAKSSFLANMSHELRTPLNAILGFSAMMTGDNNLTEEQNKYLKTIGRSGKHLLNIINEILEISKIEAGRITIQEEDCDLYQLLEELENIFKINTDSKGLDLIFEINENVPQYIHTDQGKLRQILMNLLSNAVKFTDHGTITLRTESTLEIDTHTKNHSFNLHFEVEDTGHGINPDEMGKVFEPFSQTESGQLSKQGTGLGMPISKEYARVMGGNLTVESKPGKGSTFRLEIGVANTSEGIRTRKKSTRKVIGIDSDQNYRILVVEDNDDSRRLLVTILKKIGFNVREAVNGQEAVSIWRQWRPHLIWMDMRMPVMDGYRATKTIRSLPQGDESTIIALTASSLKTDKEQIISCGCDAFQAKPFAENDLFDIMSDYLGVRYVYAPEGKQDIDVTAEIITENKNYIRALNDLPETLQDDLRNSVTTVDFEAALHVLRNIQKHNPLLATELEYLIKSYRFDVLARYLNSEQTEQLVN